MVVKIAHDTTVTRVEIGELKSSETLLIAKNEWVSGHYWVGGQRYEVGCFIKPIIPNDTKFTIWIKGVFVIIALLELNIVKNIF